MPVHDVLLDYHRPERIGLAEAILAQGKSTAQLEHILDDAAARQARFLFTRLSVEAFAALSDVHREHLAYDPVSRTAFLGAPLVATGPARVAVVSAGASDAPVAREAARTLEFNGHACTVIADVGVAGLWRLTARLEEIRAHAVVVAVAGMDAALPTVLGGLFPGVLIGVPTSTGYGVAAGGMTALHAMLASCSPGLTVTNIDNGYGAACAAMRALKAMGA